MRNNQCLAGNIIKIKNSIKKIPLLINNNPYNYNNKYSSKN
jgi:hypothetical protein